MIPVRQSTARTIIVGPVLDADGVAVTGSVVGDLKISKNGAAPAGLNASATLTHRHTGHYSLALTTSDLDTVGSAQITCDDTTNACPVADLIVIEEVIYDALFAASANAFSGSAGSTTLTALAAGSITATVIATGAIDADAIADNAIDAGAIAADAITAAKIANGAIDAATFAADVDAEILSYLVDDATRIDASALNTASGAVGSNGSGLTEAGGTGDHLTAINLPNQTMDIVGNITGNLSGSVGSVTGNVGGSVGSVTGAVGSVTGNVGGNVTGSIGSLATQAKADVNAEVDTALGDYDALVPADLPANFAALGINASGHVSRVTLVDTTTTNTDMRGTDNAATAANLATVAGYIDTEIASILAAVDTEIAAIKAKTDNLPADPAGLADLATAHGAGSWATATGFSTHSAADVATTILAAGDVDGFTVEESLKLSLSALVGILSGAATTTITIRSADDSADRIVATCDSNGNRSAVTLNAAG